MHIWAVANQKGGVGKTTTAVSVAGLLAKQGKRVLVVDLDPQGSLTAYFRYDPGAVSKSSYQLFTFDNPTYEQVSDLITDTGVDNLSLLPASTVLATLEKQSGANGMGLKLKNGLRAVSSHYDYVVIDTPPTLGMLLINALAACEHLIAPVQTEHLAIKGLERLINTLAMFNRSRKTDLTCTIIPTMFDRRTQASIVSLRHLKQTYPQYMWSDIIPIDTRFRDASKKALPISSLSMSTRGTKAYMQLLTYLQAPATKRTQDNNQKTTAIESTVSVSVTDKTAQSA